METGGMVIFLKKRFREDNYMGVSKNRGKTPKSMVYFMFPY